MKCYRIFENALILIDFQGVIELKSIRTNKWQQIEDCSCSNFNGECNDIKHLQYLFWIRIKIDVKFEARLSMDLNWMLRFELEIMEFTDIFDLDDCFCLSMAGRANDTNSRKNVTFWMLFLLFRSQNITNGIRLRFLFFSFLKIALLNFCHFLHKLH